MSFLPALISGREAKNIPDAGFPSRSAQHRSNAAGYEWLRLSGPFGSDGVGDHCFHLSRHCRGVAQVPAHAASGDQHRQNNSIVAASCRTFPPALSQRPDSAVYGCVDHFTYGNALKSVFRDQMLSGLRALANLFFGCVDRDGNFTTHFTVNLHPPPAWCFPPYASSAAWPRRVVDIAFAFQLLPRGEA